MDAVIREVLQPFGITRNYRGHAQLICAVRLVLEDENRLLCVKRDVYEVVAARCGSTYRRVERNLRTVVLRAWRRNRPFLTQMTRFPLSEPPTVSQFIDIVATYIQRESCKVPPVNL